MEMVDIICVFTGTAVHQRLFGFLEATRKASYPRYVLSDAAGCYGCAYASIRLDMDHSDLVLCA